MNVGAGVYISIERERFEGPVEGYPLCEVFELGLDNSDCGCGNSEEEFLGYFNQYKLNCVSPSRLTKSWSDELQRDSRNA